MKSGQDGQVFLFLTQLTFLNQFVNINYTDMQYLQNEVPQF